MGRTLILIYGVFVYGIFLVTFMYAVGFVGGLIVPKSIDTGPTVSPAGALLLDALLLGLFAVQHSTMARPWFKKRWTRIVPAPAERSTFVLFTSLILILLYWQWRPLPAVVWDVGPGAGRVVLWALFWSGWMLVFISTLLIDHFDLFGLRQVVLHARGRPYVEPRFRVTALYRVVRHPLLLGFIIAFWSAPRMTAGHLIFAAATTLYMLIAISLEERDQAAIHGEPYRAYRAKVPMLIPFLGGKPTGPVRADEP